MLNSYKSLGRIKKYNIATNKKASKLNIPPPPPPKKPVNAPDLLNRIDTNVSTNTSVKNSSVISTNNLNDKSPIAVKEKRPRSELQADLEPRRRIPPRPPGRPPSYVNGYKKKADKKTISTPIAGISDNIAEGTISVHTYKNAPKAKMARKADSSATRRMDTGASVQLGVFSGVQAPNSRRRNFPQTRGSGMLDKNKALSSEDRFYTMPRIYADMAFSGQSDYIAVPASSIR